MIRLFLAALLFSLWPLTTAVTGEDLTVGVQTSIVGAGVTGQALGDREVTVKAAGD